MNNYKFVNYDWYRNMPKNSYYNNYIPNMTRNNNYFYPDLNLNNQSSNNLFSPSEGFKNGNLFSNLYSGYKNYKPARLEARTERERDLLKIQEIGFAAHELNLYLDTHPEDQSMLALFNDYRNQVNELTRDYENKYGPLTINSNNMNESFTWVENSWPWEVRRNV